jgi:hypothetical protein
MRQLLFWISVLVIAMMAQVAAARTWRVARDGSGEFTAIQPAIEAASPGDSISVGPGEYTECQTVRLPGWNWSIEIYVYARKDDLTIIGDDPELVIIGAEAANFLNFGPMGIVAVQSCDNLRVKGITARNVYSGIYFYLGEVDIEDCIFSGCEDGIDMFADEGAIVDSCHFEGCTGNGVIAWDPSNEVVIRNSYFSNCDMGIATEGATNVSVSNCEILGDGTLDNCIVGIQFATYSTGTVSHCFIYDCHNYGITALTESEIGMTDNEIRGGMVNAFLTGSSALSGSGNEFGGGSYATILMDRSSIDLHGSHILNGNGRCILLRWGFGTLPDQYLDLRDNFWGTTDASQIADWIWDGNDDPDIHGFVLYEPFADGPVGTEPATMGRVKAMYR